MKKKVEKMKVYLENMLNHYIDNDSEKEMLVVQEVCLEFFDVFGE